MIAAIMYTARRRWFDVIILSHMSWFSNSELGHVNG